LLSLAMRGYGLSLLGKMRKYEYKVNTLH